ALWTPTILVMDVDGTERHRIEGFLPADDFLGQLELGLGKRDFESARYEAAQRHFSQVARTHPASGAAAEARYWAGVAEYKATNDAAPLKAAARDLKERWPESEWTRKASVWG